MSTPAFTRTTFAKTRRAVASAVVVILLAVGIGAGLVAMAPEASAATNGHTHCFASVKNGPHVGCQLSHSDSVRFREAVRAAGGAGVVGLCAVLISSGPVIELCATAAAAIYYWVTSYAPTLAANQCVEFGVGIDTSAPFKLEGIGYIKRIACSVE